MTRKPLVLAALLLSLAGAACNKNASPGAPLSVYLSPTPTATSTDTATHTPVFTTTASRTATDTPSSSPTDSPTATITLTSTQTPLPSATATPTSTRTATKTPTSSPTRTPSRTATFTPTDSPTDTVTDTPTATPTHTATDSPTDTPTDTATSTVTATATWTDTPTDSPTDTPSPTPTNSPTVTPTATYCPAGYFGDALVGNYSGLIVTGNMSATRVHLDCQVHVTDIRFQTCLFTTPVVLSAGIYSDVLGAPGTLIAGPVDLSIPSFTCSTSSFNLTFNFPSSVPLAPGDYWLALGSSGSFEVLNEPTNHNAIYTHDGSFFPATFSPPSNYYGQPGGEPPIIADYTTP